MAIHSEQDHAGLSSSERDVWAAVLEQAIKDLDDITERPRVIARCEPLGKYGSKKLIHGQKRSTILFLIEEYCAMAFQSGGNNLSKEAEEKLRQQLNDLVDDEDSTAHQAESTPVRPLRPDERWNRVRESQKLIETAKSAVTKALNRIRQRDSVDVLSLRSSIKDMVSSIVTDEFSLLSLATLNNKYDKIYSHSVNVSIYLMSLYKRIGKSQKEIHDIGVIGLMHDIGFSKLPEDIINKYQRLTSTEQKIKESHVMLSSQIISRHEKFNKQMMDVVSQHHEFLDGSGFPKGLKGNMLSWEGRATAIVDAFDHFNIANKNQTISDPHAGLRHLMKLGETKLDRSIVELFIQCVGIYPVGSIIKLASGSEGVVALVNRNDLLFPVVKIIRDTGRKPLKSNDLINLAEHKNDKSYKVVGVAPADNLRQDPSKYLNLN